MTYKLLQEFDKRLGDSVLFELYAGKILNTIGEKKIKSYLKELNENRKPDRVKRMGREVGLR
jgi:hypothetical protein